MLSKMNTAKAEIVFFILKTIFDIKYILFIEKIQYERFDCGKTTVSSNDEGNANLI